MNILIVEDDATPGNVLKKHLSPVGACTLVESGKTAIRLFDKSHKEKKPFDLMLLDISMPDMDGIQVLSVIRKKEKQLRIDPSDQIKIIMVTASIRMASIKQCIRLGCNSYVSKPFTPSKLFAELDRIGLELPESVKGSRTEQESYTTLVAQIIKRFNTGKIKLPVLPHMVRELQALFEKPDPSIAALAGIVEKDAVISAQLIRAANSAVYKSMENVSSLNDALVRIGIKEAVSFITAITQKYLYKSDKDLLKTHLDRLWLHSLATACACKFLAGQIKDKPLDGIFLAGTVHDIGKVLLLKAICDINPDAPLEDTGLLEAIQEVHTVFGAVLIKKWGFSKAFVQAAELHHWDRFPQDAPPELLIVHIANRLAKKCGYASFDLKKDAADESASLLHATAGQLNIVPEQLDVLCEQVSDAMTELAETF